MTLLEQVLRATGRAEMIPLLREGMTAFTESEAARAAQPVQEVKVPERGERRTHDGRCHTWPLESPRASNQSASIWASVLTRSFPENTPVCILLTRRSTTWCPWRRSLLPRAD